MKKPKKDSSSKKPQKNEVDIDTKEIDLILFDPIIDFDYLSEYETNIVAERQGISTDQVDLILSWLKTAPESYLYHINAEWLEFVEDLQECGIKVKFIHNFLGTLPITEITYRKQLSSTYEQVLEAHNFTQYRFTGFKIGNNTSEDFEDSEE